MTEEMGRRGFLAGLLTAPFWAPAVAKSIATMPRARAVTLGFGTAREVAAELAAVVRRAFIPRLIVQMHKATPLLSTYFKERLRLEGFREEPIARPTD